MPKKYAYQVTIGTPKGKPKQFTYKYGQTKDVVISVFSKAISIRATVGKLYTPEEMLSNSAYLFPDAIKKGLLLHLLFHSEGMSCDAIAITKDGEEIYHKNDKENPLIYSLVKTKLLRPIPSSFCEQGVIDTIMALSKSKYDTRISALFALIQSKNKSHEIERFMYLWMAFNGMYSYYTKLVNDEQNLTKNKPYKQEWQKLSLLQDLYGWGKGALNTYEKPSNIKKASTTAPNESKQKADSAMIFAREIISLLKRVEYSSVSRAMLEDETSDFYIQIKQQLKRANDGKGWDITPYGYVVVRLTYFYRCNMMHADSPIPLFSYKSDDDLVVLTKINRLLEELIEQALPKWLDNQYVKDELSVKAKNASIQTK